MSAKFNVLLLGAGPINFGTVEGPWNHSRRLEEILGPRLRIVGVVDKNKERAERVLAIKRADASVAQSYESTNIFNSLDNAGSTLVGTENEPTMVVDGFQPVTRGSTRPGQNTELQLINMFPKAALFIEKPISAWEFSEVDQVKQALDGRIVSVGYMLRYLKAVQEMKKLIDENGLQVMMTMATYLFAYSYAGDLEKNHTIGYWNKSLEMGPVVGQGTHIVDLTRYLSSSKVLPETIHVQTVEHSDPVGKLSQQKFDETEVSPEVQRVPRITNATWRTENGGTASFIHGVVLHEGDYDCELVVLADGWKLRLVDPYGKAPRLYIRRPGAAEEVKTVFTGDDCYHSEFQAIIDVIDGQADKSVILSSYADAAESYKLTWQIRLAGEKGYQARGGRPHIVNIHGV